MVNGSTHPLSSDGLPNAACTVAIALSGSAPKSMSAMPLDRRTMALAAGSVDGGAVGGGGVVGGVVGGVGVGGGVVGSGVVSGGTVGGGTVGAAVVGGG